MRLRKSLSKTIKSEETTQFRQYLKSIREVFNTIGKLREYSLVRNLVKHDYNSYRYLRFYFKSIKLTLEDSEIVEEVKATFIEEVAASIQEQAEEVIKKGDSETLDMFKLILPEIYKLFGQYKGCLLWKERAEIGKFYYYAEHILADKTTKLTVIGKITSRYLPRT